MLYFIIGNLIRRKVFSGIDDRIINSDLQLLNILMIKIPEYLFTIDILKLSFNAIFKCRLNIPKEYATELNKQIYINNPSEYQEYIKILKNLQPNWSLLTMFDSRHRFLIL